MKNWKTILALFLLFLAVIFDWGWFWAIFISMGLVHIIQSGEIHFVELVNRKESPKLFWFMVIIWAFLAAYSAAGYLKWI